MDTEHEATLPTLRPRADGAAGVPPVSTYLWSWFTWYACRHLRRHFHAVRLDREGHDPAPEAAPHAAGDTTPPGAPLIIYLNHPSWWDPMVALFLASHIWPQRRHYGPIDARMLEKYRFFRKLGFFGVDTAPGPAGAGAFFRTSAAILSERNTCLWVTAEGEFTDPRRRPVRLKPGLAHLARRLSQRASEALVVPLAVEYTFWTESTPEVLLRFGRPVPVGGRSDSAAEWNRRLESLLEHEMDRLAARASTRDPAKFSVLLGGASGTSPFYDGWRWLRARLRGQSFDRAHDPGSIGLLTAADAEGRRA